MEVVEDHTVGGRQRLLHDLQERFLDSLGRACSQSIHELTHTEKRCAACSLDSFENGGFARARVSAQNQNIAYRNPAQETIEGLLLNGSQNWFGYRHKYRDTSTVGVAERICADTQVSGGLLWEGNELRGGQVDGGPAIPRVARFDQLLIKLTVKCTQRNPSFRECGDSNKLPRNLISGKSYFTELRVYYWPPACL